MSKDYSTSDLYDMFVAPGVSYDDVAGMSGAEMERQIAEMRRDNPDDVPMTDDQIAQEVHRFAIFEANVPRR